MRARALEYKSQESRVYKNGNNMDVPFLEIKNDRQLYINQKLARTFDCLYIDGVVIDREGNLKISLFPFAPRPRGETRATKTLIFKPWKSVLMSS